MSMIQNFMNEGAHGIIEEFENIKHENVGKVMGIFYRGWKNIISKIHETNI